MERSRESWCSHFNVRMRILQQSHRLTCVVVTKIQGRKEAKRADGETFVQRAEPSY